MSLTVKQELLLIKLKLGKLIEECPDNIDEIHEVTCSTCLFLRQAIQMIEKVRKNEPGKD